MIFLRFVIMNYELSEAFFDILKAKAKCKANLRVIYIY